MNIHIDKILFQKLINVTIFQAKIGSVMYGNTNQNSDIDILHIYVESKEENNYFIKSNHQFQYKENDIDYIFVSLDTFIKNTLNGDSTINFEVIHSGLMDNTPLQFLNDMKNDFINYKIVRSYLGLARRDYRHLVKCKKEYEYVKRICHIYRGLLFTKRILNNNFSVKFDNDNLKEIEVIKQVVKCYKSKKEYCDLQIQEINKLRIDINSDSYKYELVNYMNIDSQQKLFNNLVSFKNSDIYQNNVCESLGIMNLIFDSLNNGVTY